MAKYIFWNRRSGVDRRLGAFTESNSNENRRITDRRSMPNNDYVLVLGRGGLDSFELLILVPIVTVLSFVGLGNLIGIM